MINLEQGLNGEILLWQQHFLTEAFADRDVVFSEEPVLNPSSDRFQTPFRLDGEHGVHWDWHDQQSAQVRTFDETGARLTGFDISPLAEPHVSFGEVGGGAWGELTLYQQVDSATSTLKFEIPPSENVEMLRQPDLRSVIIRAKGGASLFGLSIEKLKPKGDGLRPSDPPVPQIQPGQTSMSIPVAPKERCYIVVFRRLLTGPRILRCATNNEAGMFEDLSPIGEKDVARLTRYLGLKNPASTGPSVLISNWSNFSADRLSRLKMTAAEILGIGNLNDRYVETHATGLCRVIALLEIGCKWVNGNPRSLIDSLNGGDFLGSLRAADPVLIKIAERFPNTIEERIWVLQNLRHPRIVSVVIKLSGRDLNSFRRELHLEDMRTAAAAVRPKGQAIIH